MSKNDGGPAFPPMHDPRTHEFGMSLRDWFAGQALAGLMAAPDICGTYREIAEDAYRFADAMLATRATGQEAR